LLANTACDCHQSALHKSRLVSDDQEPRIRVDFKIASVAFDASWFQHIASGSALGT
jgi:hypothetical protein